MTPCPRWLRTLFQILGTLWTLLGDSLQFLCLCLRFPTALAAENLFLRKQLALYQERQVTPRRATDATRFALTWLAAGSTGDRLWSLCSLPPCSAGIARGFACSGGGSRDQDGHRSRRTLQALIRQMARDNPTWGQERIANELLLKLGLRVSPRTVRKYMPKRQRLWTRQTGVVPALATFVRNHAQAIVACDFCVVVTATFRLLYVFVLMEHATRRILHVNVTAHPTAAWTLQQLREAIPADHGYRFLIHDRDSIFSRELDQHVRKPGTKGPENAAAESTGECPVRTAHRHAAAGMPGFGHPSD